MYTYSSVINTVENGFGICRANVMHKSVFEVTIAKPSSSFSALDVDNLQLATLVASDDDINSCHHYKK